jgi:hypothetical protein
MRFNVAYVKQHPAMFGTIFVVFGLLLWLMLNKGHASSGGGQYVTTGPSEALQAANLQAGTALQLKQLDLAGAAQSGQMQLAALTAQINGQEQMANMQMQYQFAELAANSALGSKQIDASLIALQAQLDNQLETTNSNNQFMVDYAKVAADNATAQVMINANLQATLGAQSVDLQKQLSADQLKAYTVGSLASVIPSLSKSDRDNTLNLLISKTTNGPTVQMNMHGDGLFVG